MPIQIVDSSNYESSKIKSPEEIAEIAKERRSRGHLVGLCVGGFDLLHPGHMVHFNSAKKFCDTLIVGVTTEKFNAQRKGNGRPIYPDALRVFSVSQVESVDYAFISPYKGAVEVISMIRPHFYIKGPDYVNDFCHDMNIERDAIAAIGGEMRYTADEKLSTTDIVKYIQVMGLGSLKWGK